MNDLIKQVTPLTRAIVWIVKDACDSSNPYYGEMDYLLDGLITANLRNTGHLSSRVIVGKSFNRPLYVLILNEFKSSEVASFVTLIKDEIGPETDIMVIDEAQGLQKLKDEFKSLKANIKVYS